MKSKSEIDQNYGYTSDRAAKYYLLSIAVMLLGFFSVFFLGLGILFLIGSFAKVSSTLKELYLENCITVDSAPMSSTSAFKMNESDVVQEDEYSSDSFSLSDTTNPSSPTQIAWRQYEDDLRHR
ncbi:MULTISPECIES: hypothetical protein [Aeromonas]|uniref:hypothetical protein n=1 Tax=Aeromonas TaxID=642 RepID=UPI00111954B7|nr:MULTISPECIES: hypothetical protein [Aeromonas]NEX81747.1 hypothetical protein [Aeromonas rivipollensis]